MTAVRLIALAAVAVVAAACAGGPVSPGMAGGGRFAAPAFTSGAAPQARQSAAMAYYPPGREIVLFGGETPYRHGFVRTEVRVAQWLADEEFPATRVADLDHLSQPFDVGGRLVTVWDLVRQATERATIADLGRILRALHRLAPRGRAGIAVAGRR